MLIAIFVALLIMIGLKGFSVTSPWVGVYVIGVWIGALLTVIAERLTKLINRSGRPLSLTGEDLVLFHLSQIEDELRRGRYEMQMPSSERESARRP